MYLVKVTVKESPIEGRGVSTLEDIRKGSVVWKFDPAHDKSMSPTEFDALDEAAKESLLRVAYLSSTSNRWVYPPEGDPAHFTNHSEKNNMTAVTDSSVSEEPFFIANRDIQAGEELTNNYEEFDTRPSIKVEGFIKQWHILNRDGTPTKEEELPERPEDSNPMEGEAFRPWYKQDEHLHIEGGKIVGIHVRGTLEEVQVRLRAYLDQEAKILEHFGGNEDVLLPDADSFLNKPI